MKKAILFVAASLLTYVVEARALLPFEIYSVPSEVRRSELFDVQVSADGEQWQRVPVIMALTADGGASIPLPAEVYAEFGGLKKGHHTVKCAIASFAVRGKTWVRVEHLKGASQLDVSPERLGVECRRDGNAIIFAVDKASKLMVRPDGDVVRTLSLLVDDCDDGRISPRGYNRVMHFKSGYHTADNSRHITLNEHGAPVVTVREDNTLILLDKGMTFNF